MGGKSVKRVLVVILATLLVFFAGGIALADDGDVTYCNSNNPKNCPQGAPNASSPICGKGEHTGNPHCKKDGDKDDSTPTPKPTPTPTQASTPTPSPTPQATPTPTPAGKVPGVTAGPKQTDTPSKVAPTLRPAAPAKPVLPDVKGLPSTSTN